jgi:site-specific DNA-methyltransferase (adenine-specific)
MGKFANKFESAKQDWETPIEFFSPINEEFNFTLDAAASAENAKVSFFFSEEEDGLSQSWGRHTVWLNPPYGAKKKPISAWVSKAYKESLSGATSVILIPARTNTNWFHDICLAHAEIRFIRGRPKFGDAKHGLPQPLCLVIFRPPTFTGRNHP